MPSLLTSHYLVVTVSKNQDDSNGDGNLRPICRRYITLAPVSSALRLEEFTIRLSTAAKAEKPGSTFEESRERLVSSLKAPSSGSSSACHKEERTFARF